MTASIDGPALRFGGLDPEPGRAEPSTPGAVRHAARTPPAWRARLIVARLDPRSLTLSLVMDLERADLNPASSIERAPRDALLAVNAGQFGTSLPWAGWWWTAAC